jgi:predicted ribosome quality control (RQC) complex YloA/Tae2 family protein
MTLTRTEIAAIVKEITPALVGGWIQKIFQPSPELLLLEIRAPGRTYRLLCSVHPAMARLHLIWQMLPNPPTPPSFCQLLRAQIQGARVDAIEQVPGDRIVRLSVSSREGPATLVAHLFGKRPNILLLDQHDRILGALADQRERIGQIYEPPPRPIARDAQADTLVSGHAASQTMPYPISFEMEERYRALERDSARDDARRARESWLRKTIKKEGRHLAALQRDLDHVSRYERYARYGELLKSNLQQVIKGQSEIGVVDYYDEQLPQLTIPLDPAKSPQANMDAYFAKHRKYMAAQREIVPRITALETRIGALEAELFSLKEGTWEPPVQETPRIVPLKQGRPRDSGPEGRRGPFRRFLSADGLHIFVGRDAQENDQLTFGLAKSDDLWLHAQGCPGSHVVIRLERGMDPPPETIREAATLALLYSDLKKSGKGDVVYTRRKWVKKAKGQAPGAVTITQEKSIYIALDKKRLDGLKERSANE